MSKYRNFGEFRFSSYSTERSSTLNELLNMVENNNDFEKIKRYIFKEYDNYDKMLNDKLNLQFYIRSPEWYETFKKVFWMLASFLLGATINTMRGTNLSYEVTLLCMLIVALAIFLCWKINRGITMLFNGNKKIFSDKAFLVDHIMGTITKEEFDERRQHYEDDANNDEAGIIIEKENDYLNKKIQLPTVLVSLLTLIICILLNPLASTNLIETHTKVLILVGILVFFVVAPSLLLKENDFRFLRILLYFGIIIASIHYIMELYSLSEKQFSISGVIVVFYFAWIAALDSSKLILGKIKEIQTQKNNN